MVEDTFQKLLEEYNIEKNSGTTDLMNTTIEEMTPQQRLDLINKMLEDLKSYEGYYKLEDIANNITRYLNGEIPYSEVNLNIPIVKPLNFPEDKIEEKKSYFEKRLYDLVLHENMRNNWISRDGRIAEIFIPIINRKVESLKQSIMVPKELIGVIKRIDSYPNNENNPKKYLNSDLYRRLYLFENNYKLNDLDSYNLAKLRIEKENLITNLGANKESIKKLSKKRRFYALLPLIGVTISLAFFSSTYGIYTHAQKQAYNEETGLKVGIILSICIGLISTVPSSIGWFLNDDEFKELLSKQSLRRKDLAQLEKILRHIKELEEGVIMYEQANKMKEKIKDGNIDKELNEYTTITR